MNTATAAAAMPASSSSTTPRAGGGILHPVAISAVWRRQVYSLLGNPLGYVFILAFVLATALWLFWFRGDDFFKRNLSDLGLLTNAMPWFLAVLLPALPWARGRASASRAPRSCC
jgi:hypothetical protein